MDPPAGYWKLLEPYWEQIDIYNGPERFLETYRAAPPIVQTLFAAHFFESEVSNGGLHQFFMNPTGVLAPEAVQAFRTIGFVESAAIVERAMQFFGASYPRDQEARVQRLHAEPGDTRAKWDPFVRLDDELDASLGPSPESFFDALDRLSASSEGRSSC